jgi:tetratricopeptide (TPR) repeat protein
MKQRRSNLLIMLLACFTYVNVNAQIETPAPSPTATFSQKVGLTDVTIEYSRPSMKGRSIFGDLVPHGKLWRTGANMATKITFSDDVKIDGKGLAAGTYAIFTIPAEDEWTVIFNKNYNQAGTGNYEESEDALRIQAKPHKIGDKIETFTINIEDVKPSSAVIEFGWENVIVHVPLDVSIDDKIMASIERAMSPNPNNYYAAAVYYRESGKDLDQALEWIDECLRIHEAAKRNVFWIYRQKSLIQADMGKYPDAIITAEISLSKAQEAGNDDYIKMNKESIDEWMNE